MNRAGVRTLTVQLLFMAQLASAAVGAAQQSDGADGREHAETDALAMAERAAMAAEVARTERASFSAARASQTPFFEPPEISAGGKHLYTTLTVKYRDFIIGGDAVRLRSYDRPEPLGYTIVAKPGDTLHIRLENRLPEPVDPAQLHKHDITNLHTHGLQVSPEDNSDNVFLAVRPGATYDYEIKIHEQHIPGSHWYHAHHHGSTAVQVSSGMAGMLIISGGLDDLVSRHGIKTVPFLFQQFPYRPPGENAPGTIDSLQDIRKWRELQADHGRETTINGQKQPVRQMAPGSVERWRFFHAGIADVMSLVLADQQGNVLPQAHFYEVAADGVPLGYARRTKQIDLGPGYRSDVLVKAPDSGGPYYLTDLASRAILPFQRDRPKSTSYLMRIELGATADPKEIPPDDEFAQLKRPTPVDAATPVRSRPVEFKGGDDLLGGFINNLKFKHDRSDFVTTVGDVEDWTLSSGGNEPHPFHIHISPFWAPMHDPNGQRERDKDYYAWKDTLLIHDEPVTVRMRFEEGFPGKTVLHCHRLDHEDSGMMSVIRINDREYAPPVPAAASEQVNRPAPPWRLRGLDNQVFSSDDLAERPTLLVLSRGLDCPHCVGQIALLRSNHQRLTALGLRVLLITANSAKKLAADLDEYQTALPFLALPDEDLVVFRKFGCAPPPGEEPLHGLFVISAQGVIQWQHVSQDALLDELLILQACSTAMAP
jgi:FtsP/CotA-like multicopper oxidase with cupredoxin domain/peroxiredoxin